MSLLVAKSVVLSSFRYSLLRELDDLKGTRIVLRRVISVLVAHTRIGQRLCVWRVPRWFVYECVRSCVYVFVFEK